LLGPALFLLHSLVEWCKDDSFPVLKDEEVRHGKVEDCRVPRAPGSPSSSRLHMAWAALSGSSGGNFNT